MKKIIFTVTNDLTFDRRMQRICTTLATNGFAVELVGRELPQSAPLEVEAYQQHRIKCLNHSGKLFYAEYNYRLMRYLQQQQADMVCAIDLDTIVPCFEVALQKGWKKVYDAHEYFEEVPEVIDRPLVQRAWHWIAMRYIRMADLAYTVGPALAKEMGTRYGQHFEVIRNVPDLVESVSAIEDRHYLLYQGALNVGRGLEPLLKAMQHIDMPLKIAGEGDLSSELRQLAVDLSIEDKVEFIGFVKPKDLPQLTAGAYVGVNLLENKGKSYYFSLANKFFDYMQAEIPSINMNFPEYSGIINEYPVGLLLEDVAEKTIIDSIHQLVKDKTLYKSLANNRKEAKQLFNWQKECEKLLTLYREI